MGQFLWQLWSLLPHTLYELVHCQSDVEGCLDTQYLVGMGRIDWVVMVAHTTTLQGVLVGSYPHRYAPIKHYSHYFRMLGS